jgi:hypothetical protein
MLKLILGVVVGVLAARLSSREGALDQLGVWVASAPAPLRERADSVRAATATGARRLTDVVQSAPLPPPVKSRAQAALAAVQTSRPWTGGPATPPQSAESLGVSTATETVIPDEVLAEQDAAARAAEDAQREQQAGR